MDFAYYSRPFPALQQHAVILVDDGIAAGSTMRAAAAALRRLGAERLVIAVPTGHGRAVDSIGAEADALYCANMGLPSPWRTPTSSGVTCGKTRSRQYCRARDKTVDRDRLRTDMRRKHPAAQKLLGQDGRSRAASGRQRRRQPSMPFAARSSRSARRAPPRPSSARWGRATGNVFDPESPLDLHHRAGRGHGARFHL